MNTDEPNNKPENLKHDQLRELIFYHLMIKQEDCRMFNFMSARYNTR